MANPNAVHCSLCAAGIGHDAPMTSTDYDSCSYCASPALYIGSGSDGDSYCADHLDHAWNGATPL